MRVGGLREDLPRGFHDAVRAFLDRFPPKLDEYEDLLTKNEIYLQAHARCRRDLEGRRGRATAWSARSPARRASTTTSARRFRISATRPSSSTCRPQTDGDVYARYLVRVAEMRESVKICRQALERISPIGAWAVDDPRITPPPKDRVYTEMEALIQHFLIYSQGFTVPAGEAYVPVEGPRGEQGFYDRLGRHQPAVARQVARAVAAGLPGAREDDRRRPDCRRDRRDRVDRRRDGRRGPVSFHPTMAYDATFHQSSRTLTERAAVRLHAGEPRALRRDRGALSAGSAPVGRAAGAVPRAAPAGLHHRPTRCATSPICSGITPADVEDVVSYYTMFYTKPVGKFVLSVCRTLSCALNGAERVTEEICGKLGIRPGETDPTGTFTLDRGRVPRRVRPRAGRDGQRRVARVPDAGGRRRSCSTICAARGEVGADRLSSRRREPNA